MYQDFAILSFNVDFNKSEVEVIQKLEHFAKAPKCIIESSDDNLDLALLRFTNGRSIPVTRADYEEILKATSCKTSFELSFKGHGLSLSNHYWYKKEDENITYKDINFFTNKWDDSFARAVLNQDYQALKHADINVPDIVTPGWGVKGWIYEKDGPKLYKLGIHKDHFEEALGEVVASKIATCLFNEGEVLKYELKKIGNRYASVSSLMINIDEDLIPLSEYIDHKTYNLYRDKAINKELSKEFFEVIKNSGIPGLYEFFIKITCLRDLCFASDLHFENISLIKNAKTNKIRIAPIYDLGGAFGSGRTGQNLIANPNSGVLMLVYFLFNDLDPSWDYSWYEPNKLIGIEDEIRNTLSKSPFYTSFLIDRIIEVYQHQKATLDEMASKNNK